VTIGVVAALVAAPIASADKSRQAVRKRRNRGSTLAEKSPSILGAATRAAAQETGAPSELGSLGAFAVYRNGVAIGAGKRSRGDLRLLAAQDLTAMHIEVRAGLELDSYRQDRCDDAAESERPTIPGTTSCAQG
jgi:hypothetical protein